MTLYDGRMLFWRWDTELLSAGTKVRELSEPDDLILVLSSSDTGTPETPNNYQKPDVFFHADRRGRVLGRDQQSAAELESALAFGPRLFVNFTSFNDGADVGFFEAIRAKMDLLYEADGYQIYRVRNTASNSK